MKREMIVTTYGVSNEDMRNIQKELNKAGFKEVNTIVYNKDDNSDFELRVVCSKRRVKKVITIINRAHSFMLPMITYKPFSEDEYKKGTP